MEEAEAAERTADVTEGEQEPEAETEPEEAPSDDGEGQVLEGFAGRQWDPEQIQEFSKAMEDLADTKETVVKLAAMAKEEPFTVVKTLIVHELLHKAALLPPEDIPLPEMEEVILALLSDGVGATASGISLLFTRVRSLAEACSSPVMGEIIRVLQDQGESTDMVPLFLLGNALLDAALQIPPEVSQALVKLLTNVKNQEGKLMLHRLEGTPLQPPQPEPPTPSKAASDKTYTESEVKSFLYQRKLEWEGQLRKRDRAIKEHVQANAGLKEEIEKLTKSLEHCQEMLTLREGKLDEAERQIEALHQKNLEVENRLEDNVVFLREREHQLTTLEAKVERLDTENAILGNENRQLSENNKELQSYVAELIDRNEKGI